MRVFALKNGERAKKRPICKECDMKNRKRQFVGADKPCRKYNFQNNSALQIFGLWLWYSCCGDLWSRVIFCRPGSQPRTLNWSCTVKFVWLFSHLCPSPFRLSCSSVLLGTVSWSLSTHFLAAPNNFSAHAQCWPTRWSVQQKKRKPLLQSRTQSPRGRERERGEWWDDPTNPCALTSSSPSRSLEEATFTPNSEF